MTWAGKRVPCHVRTDVSRLSAALTWAFRVFCGSQAPALARGVSPPPADTVSATAAGSPDPTCAGLLPLPLWSLAPPSVTYALPWPSCPSCIGVAGGGISPPSQAAELRPESVPCRACAAGRVVQQPAERRTLLSFQGQFRSLVAAAEHVKSWCAPDERSRRRE